LALRLQGGDQNLSACLLALASCCNERANTLTLWCADLLQITFIYIRNDTPCTTSLGLRLGQRALLIPQQQPTVSNHYLRHTQHARDLHTVVARATLRAFVGHAPPHVRRSSSLLVARCALRGYHAVPRPANHNTDAPRSWALPRRWRSLLPPPAAGHRHPRPSCQRSHACHSSTERVRQTPSVSPNPAPRHRRVCACVGHCLHSRALATHPAKRRTVRCWRSCRCYPSRAARAR
jgi:hypothetical protein